MDQPTVHDTLKKLERLVGQWSLMAVRPDGAPFSQRFTARFEDSEDRIVGRWEKSEDGSSSTLDFDLIFIRVK